MSLINKLICCFYKHDYELKAYKILSTGQSLYIHVCKRCGEGEQTLKDVNWNQKLIDQDLKLQEIKNNAKDRPAD